MKIAWQGWRGMKWEQMRARLHSTIQKHYTERRMARSHFPQGIDKARKKVNRAMHKLMCSSGNGVIRHDNIRYRQTQLFRKDKVHLTEEGLDLFWSNIRNFIAEWWRSR
ncbi:hypothetical protein XELAEV_18005946mg [Xenopus laevis]|uniref:Uncharacterized protein n=1 Tax=Xenopus laevis TaxID=8355 RepID=A0A974I3C1_XENLA|nr:hypothetical protein XELAEV_18005946mg [Xenopus laevis]